MPAIVMQQSRAPFSIFVNITSHQNSRNLIKPENPLIDYL